jgi:hypothetical protein
MPAEGEEGGGAGDDALRTGGLHAKPAAGQPCHNEAGSIASRQKVVCQYGVSNVMPTKTAKRFIQVECQELYPVGSMNACTQTIHMMRPSRNNMSVREATRQAPGHSNGRSAVVSQHSPDYVDDWSNNYPAPL